MRVATVVPLRDQAREIIRASIIGGELQEGEIYSATALARRLGVSATPVREAMLDLAAAGLVQAVRNRGFLVVAMDDQKLDEIYELRTMLEAPAMRSVAERITDEELKELEDMVDEMDRIAEQGAVPEMLVADRTFHLSLLAITGNLRLVRLVGDLRDQTRLVGIKHLAESGKLPETTREHREMLAALRARDGERAELLMRAHLEHVRGSWAGREEAEEAAAARRLAEPS